MATESTRPLRAGPACALVAAVLLVAACGSDSSSSSSSSSGGGGSSDGAVAAAQKAVDAATANITEWPGPDSSPPAVKGKSFVVIPCSLAAEGCKRQAAGFIEAAKVLGWSTKEIDPQGDQSKTNAALVQAITLKADGVFMVSVDPKTVSGSLAKVRKAGIPVIDAASGGPSAKPSPSGLNHEVSLHGGKEGDMLANFIVANSGGKANVAIINDTEFATVVERVDATKKVLATCGGCKVVKEINVPVTSVGTTLGSQVKGLLQANPSIDTVWAPYDAAATDIVQAVNEAGLAGKVSVVSFNGNTQNLSFIAKGQVQTADVGEALEWVGWAGADDFNRIFNKADLPEDDGVPSKLFTKDNLPPSGKDFSGDLDFRAKYRSLWKVDG